MTGTAQDGTQTFTWNYREQPPLNQIAEAVHVLSGGVVSMVMPETGSQEYELVITAQPLPAVVTQRDAYRSERDEAREAYSRVCAERDLLRGQAGAVYTERARLVAFLAACYSAVHVPDHDDDEYAIVYVTTPAGQMSWHVRADDLALFAEPAFVTETVEWDGHTTEAKYERLAEMADRIARVGGFAGLIASMAKPEYKEAHPLVAERDQAREVVAEILDHFEQHGHPDSLMLTEWRQRAGIGGE
jgi:hypothetical protein